MAKPSDRRDKLVNEPAFTDIVPSVRVESDAYARDVNDEALREAVPSVSELTSTNAALVN